MTVRIYILFLMTAFCGLFSFGPKAELTFFLIGDSTVADKPYAGSNPEKGWGQVLPLYLKEGLRVENHAVNGRSTKSFRDEGRWDNVLERLKPGDYVLIEFGHNDAKTDAPERFADADTDYRENLRNFIREARNKGARPVLATPIMRRNFKEGRLVDKHGLYPVVVREVAAELDVPLLDLHLRTSELLEQFGEEKSKELFLHYRPGDFEVFPDGRTDDTHLSGTGAFKVCDLAVEEMKKVLQELAVFFKK